MSASLAPGPELAPCVWTELHLSQLPADEESPEVETFGDQLDHRIGEVQLPDAILDGFEKQVAVRWSPSTERLERGGRSRPS